MLCFTASQCLALQPAPNALFCSLKNSLYFAASKTAYLLQPQKQLIFCRLSTAYLLQPLNTWVCILHLMLGYVASKPC
jgi:hypothetical protein